MRLGISPILLIFSIPGIQAFTFHHHNNHHTRLHSSTADSDFQKPVAVNDRNVVDANRYNVDLETAADLWTASVQDQRNAEREAGIPYMDSKSKDYFVDDIRALAVSRDGGMGLELLELAGGRSDGLGITIVSVVSEGGNAEKAGILPGDSIASITVLEKGEQTATVDETVQRSKNTECKDFDVTIDALANFPGDSDVVYLDIKRMRRWPKIKVKVEYPLSQCAEGVDNVKTLELFAGENLQRALLNRGIVLDDPGQPRCDFCGSNACYVSISKGKTLLNERGLTEEKRLKNNPKVRLSCKTVVGYNMQEGDLSLRVNLAQWKGDK